MIAWLPLLACLFLVQHFTSQSGALDAGTVGGCIWEFFSSVACFVARCLASAISQSQMTAAMISFVLGISLFSLRIWRRRRSLKLIAGHWQVQVLSYFNLFDQMEDFARGAVDTRAVIFYVSATFFFLFLTLRMVESRRWK